MSYSVHTIREIAIGVFDGPHATPELHEDGAAVFLGITNLTESGSIDLSGARYVSEADYPRWTKRVIPQGDDVVFTYEATLNRYAIIPEGFKCCLGRRTALIRPDKQKIDHQFLFYYFSTPDWRAQIQANILTGATVDRIPLTKFPEFTIRVPSLAIQSRIASILSAYDDLIAANQRRIQLLEESARILYREWFVKLRFPGHEMVTFVNGVPEGWEKGTAHDFISILSGGTPKTGYEHYWDGGIPFFTPKDSPNFFYVTETEKTITESGLNNCNSHLFPKDTIFITARGTVGKISLAQRPMAMNQSCYALVPKQDYDNLFLFLAMRDAVEQFKQVASGGVFAAIVVDTFKVIPFVKPSSELTTTFGRTVRPSFDQVEALILQNSALKQARDLLLPKLMSGALDVSRITLPKEIEV